MWIRSWRGEDKDEGGDDEGERGDRMMGMMIERCPPPRLGVPGICLWVWSWRWVGEDKGVDNEGERVSGMSGVRGVRGSVASLHSLRMSIFFL